MGDWVIVEWDDSNRMNGVISDCLASEEEAIDHAKELLEANRASGRSEHFTVHQLDDFVWSSADPARGEES